MESNTLADLTDWVSDISNMHDHYGVREKVRQFDQEKLKKFLEFRVKFLEEEMKELKDAETAEDVVDALIDLCVVAIGTLDLFDVDAHKAWNVVHDANMSKEVGIKESRPNPLGLPDLIKPEGWKAPTHEHNHGLLNAVQLPIKYS
jgi:predicted HAD superfamily Cof-like phosphohydrolase